MLFGEKLRVLRQENNLTQPELAEKLGVEQSWLSKIENDKCLPSSQLLMSVLETFGLRLDELLADLDPLYVKRQLNAVPEVRDFLEGRNRKLLHNRRRWLIGSAVASVIGFCLLYAGFMALLIPNVQYEYYSPGVLIRGESRLLFHETERVIWQFGLLGEGGDSNETVKNAESDESLQLQLAAYFREVERRRDEVVNLTSTYRGENYAVLAKIPDGIRDIYGNTPQIGDGFRDFTLTETHNRESLVNRFLQLFGVMLALVGLFGFFTDYRLSRTV